MIAGLALILFPARVPPLKGHRQRTAADDRPVSAHGRAGLVAGPPMLAITAIRDQSSAIA
jgi:hypothetical protein